MRKFDRIGDWKEFSSHMEGYLERPIKKYGAGGKLPDLLYFTGLTNISWNILKYALRVILFSGKEHDMEKIAHFAQIFWTRARDKGRKAPFFTQQEADTILEEIKFLTEKEDLNKAEMNSGKNIAIFMACKNAALKCLEDWPSCTGSKEVYAGLFLKKAMERTFDKIRERLDINPDESSLEEKE